MTLRRRPDIVLRSFNNDKIQKQGPTVMIIINDVDQS